jgi:site-specific recombinase XerD
MSEYVAPVAERITLAEAGQRLISHLTMLGRKVSTLEGYRSYLEIHLLDFFGEKPIHEISKTDIERFVEDRLRQGQSVKSVRNYLGLLHSILEFALRRGWVASNPCKLVDKPQPPEVDADVHFLDRSELDALL